MKQNYNNLIEHSLMKKLVFTFLMLVVFSCGFNKKEEIFYENIRRPNGGHSVFFGGVNNSECILSSINDTSLTFDNAEIHFPSDNSIVTSYRESYYSYIF